MIEYTDKNGVVVKSGDILKYDQQDECRYGKSIDEVILVDGELCGVQRIAFPFWTVTGNVDADALPLRVYCLTVDSVPLTGIMIDAEVIGNIVDNPEMISIKHTEQIFGIHSNYEISLLY